MCVDVCLIDQCFDNLTNAKRLLREIKILRMLSHHNVIGYRGLLMPSIPATFNSLLIVFEFVDTDLAKLLASDQPITNQHGHYARTHTHTVACKTRRALSIKLGVESTEEK